MLQEPHDPDRLQRMEVMLADVHREILGEMGGDRIGLKGEMREARREIGDLRSRVDALENVAKKLEDAPGAEAEQEVKAAKATRRNFGQLIAAAFIGGGISQAWQMAAKAVESLFSGHH